MKPDFGLLQRISDKLRTADDEYRRRYPYRFADRDILFIENVAHAGVLSRPRPAD